MLLGEARIHAEDFGCEQRRLVAARAGADFEDDVLLVVGIFGQQQDLDRFLQRRDPRLEHRDLFLGHGAQVRVALGQHAARIRQPLARLLQLAILLHRLLDLAQSLADLLIFFVVVQHFRQRELRLQFIEALLHLFQAIQHGKLRRPTAWGNPCIRFMGGNKGAEQCMRRAPLEKGRDGLMKSHDSSYSSAN